MNTENRTIFNKWWKKNKGNISVLSIPGEIKYFAAKAWDAAIEKENQSFCACDPKPATYWYEEELCEGCRKPRK